MKKIEPTTENALFVIVLNPQAKTCMQSAKPFFEPFCYRLVAGIDG